MSQVRFHPPKPEPKFLIESNDSEFKVTVLRCSTYKPDYADFLKNTKATSFVFEVDGDKSQLICKITKAGFNTDADKAFRSSLALINKNNDIYLSDSSGIITKYELYLKLNGLTSEHVVRAQYGNGAGNGNVKA